jgi:TPR repeat protein
LTLRACELGSLDACLALQPMYMHGAAGLPDYSRVLATLRRGFALAHRTSCAGEDSACIAAAKQLAADAFPVQPRPLAPDAAQNACLGGDPLRCMQLVRLHSAGSASTPKDSAAVAEFRAKAMALWNSACDRGVGSSCLSVSRLLRGGPDGAHDYAGAALYAKKGCNDAHDRTSCIVLAKMYENGEGVAKDAAHAKRCLDAAMDVGGAAPSGCP